MLNPFNLELSISQKSEDAQAPFSQVEVEETTPPTITGILEPGGTFVSESGVTITAPEGTLTEPAQVSVEIVEDPTNEAPLQDGSVAVSPFYKLESPGNLHSFDNPSFEVTFPIPDGESAEDIFVTVLIPQSHFLHRHPNDPEFMWSSFGGVYPIDSNLSFTVPTLYDPGLVYVIVKRVTAQNE